MSHFADEVKANHNLYCFIVECAEYYFKKGNIVKSLAFCQKAAHFAVFNYCGFYSELQLEYLLKKLGQVIITSNAKSPKRDNARILHYATEVSEVGGHTRLLENWIRNDLSNIHDVVLTGQSSSIPIGLIDAVKLAGGRLILLDNADINGKVNILHEMWANYRMVILHHHPHDIIPVLAFSEDADVPVAVLNHGEHRYWIGTTICDILIQSRESMIDADRTNRFMDVFALLPIPVQRQNPVSDAYDSSRRQLGIGDGEVILLSIGSKYKFVPIDNKNFFQDITDVLEHNFGVKILVIGISPTDEIAKLYAHPRIEFISPTRNIEKYQHACDVYIEGYPFSSFTAYMEVAMLGKAVHRMYEAPRLNRYSLEQYPTEVVYYDNKLEWIQGLNKLILNQDLRLQAGANERNNMLVHADDSWKQYLALFYDEIKNLKHKVKYKRYSVAGPLLGDNELCLHKVQGKLMPGFLISDFYDLSISLKIKAVKLGRGIAANFQDISYRDLLWFLLKAH